MIDCKTGLRIVFRSETRRLLTACFYRATFAHAGTVGGEALDWLKQLGQARQEGQSQKKSSTKIGCNYPKWSLAWTSSLQSSRGRQWQHRYAWKISWLPLDLWRGVSWCQSRNLVCRLALETQLEIMNCWLPGLSCPALIPNHRTSAFCSSKEISLADPRL